MDLQKKASEFKELFNTEYDKLCKYALVFIQDVDIAEDIVQEVFTRVWENKKELIGKPDVRYYLITSVKNNCLTYLSKEKKHKSFVETSISSTQSQSFVADEEEISAEVYLRLMKALKELPERCKEVFVMVKFRKMSYKETADVLGISVKTVDNHMGKALKVLRRAASF